MRSRLLLLGAQTVTLGVMTAFLVVPASALFLSEFGAATLPYAYIAVAVAGVAVSWVMSRAQRRLSLTALATTTVAAYLAVVAVGWVVLVAPGGVWVTFPLVVLFPLSIPVGFSLVGAQAGRLLDVRQMKARFPLVAAGFPAGFAVGGLVAAALVGPLGGPENLLLLNVLTTVVLVLLVVVTGRRYADVLRVAPAPTGDAARRGRRRDGSAPRDRHHRGALLRNRLVALIFGYQLLSAAVTQLLDYMVWERAAARYPDPSDLARFQGLFGAVINVTSLAFVLLVAGWLLTRFGVGLGLAANPAGVLALLVVTTAVGYAGGPATLGFFVLVCALQVTDIALTDGTTRTSINATYQALQPEQRVTAQTTIEGAGVPLALGVVGVLLLAFDALDLDVRAVTVLTLLLTAVWVVTAVLAYREYGVNLRTVLSRRAWDPVVLRVDDDASRTAVGRLLVSDDPRDVETALEALADPDGPGAAGSPGSPEEADAARHLNRLLDSDDPGRRLLGVTAIGSTGPVAPGVRERLPGLLADGDPAVRLAAAVHLVGAPGEAGETARSVWLAGVRDEEPGAARLALEAAAGRPGAWFAPHLLGLAGTVVAPAGLHDALAAHVDHVLPDVSRLLDDPGTPRHTRQRLVHALGEAGTPQARDLLVAHLDDGDPAVVDAAARALAAAGHREPSPGTELRHALASQAERAHRCLVVLAALQDHPGTGPLRDALHDEVEGAARRTEVLLDLVHDPRAIGSGLAGLGAALERDRSTAIEMLEVTVGRSTAHQLLAIADPTLDDDARRRALAGSLTGRTDAGTEQQTPARWLRELALDEAGYWHEPWLRACALYALGHLPAAGGPADVSGLAGGLVGHDDPAVAETARWLLARSTR